MCIFKNGRTELQKERETRKKNPSMNQMNDRYKINSVAENRINTKHYTFCLIVDRGRERERANIPKIERRIQQTKKQ